MFDKFLMGLLLLPADTDTAAADTTTTADTADTTDTSDTTTTDDTVDDTTNEGQDDLDDNGVEQAKLLYKELLGPNRDSVIAAMAQKAGLFKTPPSEEVTNKDVKVQKKAVQEILKTALPEYPALAEKLAPAIEELLKQEREEHNEELKVLSEQQVANEVEKATERLHRETKGESRKFENRMAELADEIGKGPNVSMDTYIKRLYTIAASEVGNKKATGQIADKIRRNATNASERARSNATAAPGGRTPMPAKKGIDAAVNAAWEQLLKG